MGKICQVVRGPQSARPGGPPSALFPWWYVPLPPILSIITLRARKLFLLYYLRLWGPLHHPQQQERHLRHTLSGTFIALHTHARGWPSAGFWDTQGGTGRKGRGVQGKLTGTNGTNGTNGEHKSIPRGKGRDGGEVERPGEANGIVLVKIHCSFLLANCFCGRPPGDDAGFFLWPA